MNSTNTELHILNTTYNSHKTIIKLLPNYINSSLNVAENTKIENHLSNCYICQSELSRLQQIENKKKLTNNKFSILGYIFKSQPFNQKKLNNTSVFNQSEAVSFKINNIPNIISLPMPALAMVSTIFVSLLLPRLLFRSPEEINTTQFKTLSNSEIASVQKNAIRVIFLDDTQKTNIDNLLDSVNGRITSGPNEQGEYSIAIDSELNAKNVVGVIESIKKDTNVLFAEPGYTTLTSDNN